MKMIEGRYLNNRDTGTKYEQKAMEYLVDLGYNIVEQNFRCKIGEIDIIGMDNEELVFVEVKYRKDNKYGGADYAISSKKQRTIMKVAHFFLLCRGYSESQFCRFDSILITGEKINHIKNSFGGLC